MVALDGAIMPGRQAYTCMVLDRLPSLVILGMPIFADKNPAINWYAKSVMFGDQVVLGTSSLCETQAELYSLRFLMKTVCKSQSAAWFALL